MEIQTNLISLYSKHKNWNPALSLERNFLSIMNPDMQSACAANPEQCYFGSSPSIAELKIATSSKLAQQWVVIQIDSVLSSLGKKDSVSADVIKAIAQDIMFNYAWLNTSEFMLFCSRVRVGKYGQLAFGDVTVNDITSKLEKFKDDRFLEFQRFERNRERIERERERDEWKRTSVSHEDAIKIINAAADGDVEAQHLLGDDPENWKFRIHLIKWLEVSEETKKKITDYFGVYLNVYTKKLTACFENFKYPKFLEGVEKGYYSLITQ